MTKTKVAEVLDGVSETSDGKIAGWRIVMLMMAASLGYFVVQLDVSIVNLSIPSIQAYYHTDIATLQWVVNAYTLTFSVFLLSAGILGDRYGTKRFLIIGYVIFFIGSIACGFAPSISALLAARALQGIGAAIIVPNSLAVINSSFAHDSKRRVMLLSIWMAFGGAALTSGPILGGIITSSASWRYIFLINLPICVAGVLLTLKSVRTLPVQNDLRRQDWVGQGLILLFSTAILMLIINYDEMSPTIRTALVVIVMVGFVLFVITELKSNDPAVPLNIFMDASFCRAVILGALVNFIYFGVVFFSSLYFRSDMGMTDLQAGLAFIPITLPLIISNIAGAKISRKHGPDRSIAIGLILLIAGMFCLALPASREGYLQMLPAFLLISSGVGFITPMVTAIALHAVEPERGGMVSAVLNFFRQISGAFGVAVFGVFMTLPKGGSSYDAFGTALVALAYVLILSTLVFSAKKIKSAVR